MGGKNAAGGGFNPNANISGNAGAGLHNFAPGDGFGGFGGKSAGANAAGNTAARQNNLSAAVARTGAQAPPLPRARPTRAPIAPTSPPIPPTPSDTSRMYLNPLPDTSSPTTTTFDAVSQLDPRTGLPAETGMAVPAVMRKKLRTDLSGT